MVVNILDSRALFRMHVGFYIGFIVWLLHGPLDPVKGLADASDRKLLPKIRTPFGSPCHNSPATSAFFLGPLIMGNFHIPRIIHPLSLHIYIYIPGAPKYANRADFRLGMFQEATWARQTPKSAPGAPFVFDKNGFRQPPVPTLMVLGKV